MTWIELNKPPIEGLLNTNRFVSDKDSNVALRRISKENDKLWIEIGKEYEGVGFLASGGKFSRRNPQQQYEFTLKAAAMGLRVLAPIDIEGDIIYYPYIESESFQTILKSNNSELALDQLFSDLKRAHSFGIIYGDRWPPNILFSANRGITHIDFDIEIEGPCAREFEIAQVAYYTLNAGKEKVIPLMTDLLTSHRQWFDFTTFESFIRGHAIYFNKTPYGGIQKETDNFLSLLSKKVKGNH